MDPSNFDLIFGALNSASSYAFLLLILIPGYIYSLSPNYKNTFERIKNFLGHVSKPSGITGEIAEKTTSLLDYVFYGAIFAAGGAFFGALFLVIYNVVTKNSTNNYDFLLWITGIEYAVLLGVLSFQAKAAANAKDRFKIIESGAEMGLIGILVLLALVYGFFTVLQPYSPHITVLSYNWTTENCPTGLNCIELGLVNSESTPLFLNKIELDGVKVNGAFNQPFKVDPYEYKKIFLEYNNTNGAAVGKFRIYDFNGFPRTVP